MTLEEIIEIRNKALRGDMSASWAADQITNLCNELQYNHLNPNKKKKNPSEFYYNLGLMTALLHDKEVFRDLQKHGFVLSTLHDFRNAVDRMVNFCYGEKLRERQLQLNSEAKELRDKS
jgi:hypothetical protein